MALPETFTQFARTAAEQLRWKKARPLVEDELLTHLCDQRDALMAGGMDEAAATTESLHLTGDPYERSARHSTVFTVRKRQSFFSRSRHSSRLQGLRSPRS